VSDFEELVGVLCIWWSSRTIHARMHEGK